MGFTPEEMVKVTFKEIKRSDLLVANVADWPIGVGVESGFAHAKGVPILCICPANEKLANTVVGIASKLIMYADYDDLQTKLVDACVYDDTNSAIA